MAVKHKFTMIDEIDEIEARLRRDYGVSRCNSYRSLYKRAKSDEYRWAVIEGMAGFAYSHYGCSGKVAHAAARRILTSPPEPLEPRGEQKDGT
jgi:hypothetical protein